MTGFAVNFVVPTHPWMIIVAPGRSHRGHP
jgi:hypothetical protein